MATAPSVFSLSSLASQAHPQPGYAEFWSLLLVWLLGVERSTGREVRGRQTCSIRHFHDVSLLHVHQSKGSTIFWQGERTISASPGLQGIREFKVFRYIDLDRPIPNGKAPPWPWPEPTALMIKARCLSSVFLHLVWKTLGSTRILSYQAGPLAFTCCLN